MNFRIAFLIIFFSFCNTIHGQTVTSNYFNFSIKIEITDEMESESIAKGIDKDKVLISFDITSDCKVENYKIERAGELKSFTSEVERKKDKIIKQIIEHLKCESGKKIHYMLPIIIQS